MNKDTIFDRRQQPGGISDPEDVPLRMYPQDFGDTSVRRPLPPVGWTPPGISAIPAPPEKPVEVPADAKFVTAQSLPPSLVGALRGIVPFVILAWPLVQETLEAHQVGFSWGDSIESAILGNGFAIVVAVGSFIGFGVADQMLARTRKVA